MKPGLCLLNPALLGQSTVVVPASMLKFDAATSVLNNSLAAASNGEAVLRWTEANSGVKYMTQATGANQPTFVSSSSMNSQPALSFDGSNDFMDISAGYTSLSTCTMMLVAKQTASAGGGGHTLVGMGSTANGGPLYQLFGGAAGSHTFKAGNSISIGNFNDTSARLVSAVFAGGAGTFRVGGISNVSTDAGANQALTLTLGAAVDHTNPCFPTLLGYLEIWDVALTTAQLQAREATLAARFGVTAP